MLWPFRPKRPDCDVRVFRDPQSGRLTLRLQGDVGFPLEWEQPVVTLEVKLDAPIDEAVAIQLTNQLIFLLGDRRTAEPDGVE